MNWLKEILWYTSDAKKGERRLTWFGHAWLYGPNRLTQRFLNFLPTLILILILWRIW